jgi:two-component system response regulator HydG
VDVLIVDDNRDLAEGLADVLDVEGFSTRVAHTAREAQEIFAAQNFDVVFLDMKLPDGSGLDLYFEFHSRAPDTRIIVMTGFRLDQLLQQLVSDGAVGVLRKPFEMNQVLVALRDAEPEGMVLVADDDPESPDAIANFLAEHEKKPGVARNGKQAVELALNNDIDVLILDLKRPILCGVEVYLRLKEQGKVIPTIIVSGYAAEEAGVTDDFRSMSVTNCLFKPFDTNVLLESIEKLVTEKKGPA